MTPDQLRGEVPRVFRPLPTSHSQEDWPQSSHYAPSRPGWAAWDPGENWVGCPLPLPPHHIQPTQSLCTQMFGFWWRRACSLPPHPHPELLCHDSRARAESGQSWLAASPHLAGLHSPGALPSRTHNGVSPELLSQSTAKGTREVCVRARVRVCASGVEGGVSQYEYGSDRGSEWPILRDNQAEAAIERQASAVNMTAVPHFCHLPHPKFWPDFGKVLSHGVRGGAGTCAS